MNAQKIFNLAIVFVFAFSLFGAPTPVLAEDYIPGIQVCPVCHWINLGGGAPLGTVFTLTIDDPGNGVGVDYTRTAAVDFDPNYPGDFEHARASFEIPDINLYPGFIVTATAGSISNTMTVSPFAVTGVNLAANTVSGIATPGVRVHVFLGVGASGTRSPVADPVTGVWVADYSVPSDPPDDTLADLLPGVGGGASEENDAHGNTTWADWNWDWVPLIEAHMSRQYILALNWPAGDQLTMNVDNPANGTGVDYTAAATVMHEQNDPWRTWASFIWPTIGLQPGFIITVTDNNISKTLIISSLHVETVDPQTDTVAGTAEHDATMQVCVTTPNENCLRRDVLADSSGGWLADYHIPGTHPDDQQTYDLMRDSNGWATVSDADVDMTIVDWRVPNPHFSVQFPWNEVHGYEWPLGANITLTIDDPSNGAGVDYSQTKTVDTENFRPPFDTWIGFRLDGFEVKPGDIVTMTDGNTTKTHSTQELSVTNVDPEADTVSGTATAGTDVQFGGVCDDTGCAYRRVPVDANGRWLADFSVPGNEDNEQQIFDLRPGSSGEAQRIDEDGDGTVYQWNIPNGVFIIVQPDDDIVSAFNWPLGTLLAVEIDDPATLQIPDYTDSILVVGAGGFENGLELNGIFDIQPGHLVTVSGGNITKQHTVTHLTVTDIDIEADTVSGIGYPGSEIHVGLVCDDTGCASRNISVDENGNWIADFSIPASHGDNGMVFDIRPGSGSSAYEIDEDDDATNIGWAVPNPTISVRANYDQVEGSEWPLGATVTIEIDDPATQTNPDYTDTATVGVADWDPSQTYFNINLEGYDLKLGDIVTGSDGDNTKQLTVANFMITEVALETDQVYGIADPGQYVNIWTCWQSDPCASRDERADQDGNWITDFALPGEQDWEQDTADLQAGSWIDSSVSDEDGDSTMFGWYVSDQTPLAPFVVLGQEGVWIKENSDILSGDVGANAASDGPYLTDQSEVTIGQDVKFLDPASRVLGDTVYLKPGSQTYDVYSNQLKGRGQVLGVNHAPLELPFVPGLPTVPEVTPGTQNFDLKKNATLTLAAGSYGKLETNKGAVITFTGGVYHFSEWTLGDDVQVYFTAPTEIRIADKLDIGSDAFVGPASGTQSTAGDILIYVLGENGRNGRIGASPKSAKFGTASTLTANVYTPNGTLWIREHSTATGAFFGKWVEIGQKVTLTLASGWQ